MSTVGQALNNWLQRQGASLLKQEATVCDRFPDHTRGSMISISSDSALKEREMGCPITHDYTLGKVLTGTMERVAISRPEGTIGTYHTHPFGWARPSTYDILDAMRKDDKFMCIGASGKIGTKIACYEPKEPKWSELKDKLAELSSNINEFNKNVGAKYRRRGIDLRKMLNKIGSTDYVAAVQAITPQKIEEDIAKTQKSAEIAETSVKIIATKVAEAGEALEVASVELNKAITKEQIKQAEFNLRKAEEELRRRTEQAKIEHELANTARIAAKEAATKSEIRARGVTPVDSDEANKFIREGANLERSRQELVDEMGKQLIFMGYKEEWRPQKKVDGWEAEPLMLDSCKIIWETIEEELPYEW